MRVVHYLQHTSHRPSLLLAALIALLLAACSQPQTAQTPPTPEKLAVQFEAQPTAGTSAFEVPFDGARVLEFGALWPTDYEGEVAFEIDTAALPAGVSVSATEATVRRSELPWRLTVTASDGVTAATLETTFELPVKATTVEPTTSGEQETASLSVTGAVRALVTSTADDGPGSLRRLVNSVPSSGSEPIVIAFDPALFGAATTIVVETPIELAGNYALRGPRGAAGEPLVTLDGRNLTPRLINIKDDFTISLDSLVLTGAAQLAVYNLSDLTIENSVITGNGHNAPADPGTWGAGIFTNLGSLSVIDSEISGNLATQGGGIYVAGGDATITGSMVVGNKATVGAGAYVAAGGSLQIERSTMAQNSAADDGGGVMAWGVLTVVDSVVKENRAERWGGGGIFVSSGASLEMSGSLLHANVAGTNGGGLVNNGSATIINSTFTANQALRGGALFSAIGEDAKTSLLFSTVAWNSLYRTEGQTSASLGSGIAVRHLLEIKANVIIGNSFPEGYSGGDIDNGAEITSHGYNVVDGIDGPAAAGPGASTDRYGEGPATVVAAELADHGAGFAPVLPLVAGSPAIDIVPLDECTDLVLGRVMRDQVSNARPLGAACDAGASEYDAG